MENLKLKYEEFAERFKTLEYEAIGHYRDEMTEKETKAEEKRSAEARERLEELKEEYRQWKKDNDIYEECKEWGKSMLGYIPWRDEEHEYKDWLSDEATYSKVMESIYAVDENEVKKYIENTRKALNSISYTHEYDMYEVHEFIDYIEIINTNMRHDIFDNCISVLAMDILENRRLWVPYKFGFEKCLENVALEIDNVFLHFNINDWVDDEEYEFDEDEYYND